MRSFIISIEVIRLDLLNLRIQIFLKVYNLQKVINSSGCQKEFPLPLKFSKTSSAHHLSLFTTSTEVFELFDN